MVLEDYGGNGPRKINVIKDVMADLGMGPDQLELDLTELGGFAQNLCGHAYLAQVVNNRGHAQSVHPISLEPHLLTDSLGQVRYPLLVPGRVGVPGLHRLGNNLDSPAYGLPEVLKTYPEFHLGLLALGDVRKGHHSAKNLPLLSDGIGRIFDREGLAIAAPEYFLIPVADLPDLQSNLSGAILCGVGRAIGIGMVNQGVYLLAHQLARCIAQHPLGGLVDEDATSIQFKAENALVDGP
jgi:hypothetical protein